MHQIAYTARLVFAFANRSPLVAQLDRAPGFEPGCREFESLRAGHLLQDDSIKSTPYSPPFLAIVVVGCAARVHFFDQGSIGKCGCGKPSKPKTTRNGWPQSECVWIIFESKGELVPRGAPGQLPQLLAVQQTVWPM